jgi:uncharacterized protein (TIGR00730 family)
MHRRKAMMLELADAVIALPGGIGTLEEWFEAVTWWSLGYHPKPCALLNTDGFYDALSAQLARMHQDGFLRESVWRALRIGTQPEPLLEELARELTG